MNRVNSRLSSKEERLWHAVKHGDTSRVQQIFKDQKEDKKEAKDSSKNKMWGKNAIDRNQIDVNKKDKYGMSSLVVAINSGKSDIAKILISEQNADVNTRFGKNSDTALHLACHRASNKLLTLNPEKNEREKIVKLLLDNGADPNALNKNLLTPVAFTTGSQKEEFFLGNFIS